jgi:diguanylate cyclase (GGDEF)-like protein
MHWALLGVLVLLLGGLLFADLRGLQLQREREAALARTETSSTNQLYALREVMAFTSAFESYLDGSTTRRDVQIGRALLVRRLSVIDQSGTSTADRESTGFAQAFADLTRSLQEAPLGTMPAGERVAWRARVEPQIAAFQSAERREVDLASASVRQEEQQLDDQQNLANQLQLMFLVGSMVVGLGLLLLVARRVRERYDVARRSLAEDERQLQAAREEIARLSVLDRGQAHVLELVATGASLPRVFESIAAFVSDCAGGAPVRVVSGNRTLVHPPTTTGTVSMSVVWWDSVETHHAEGGRLEILGHDGRLDDYAHAAAQRGCDLLKLALERDSHVQRLQFQASHDPLTGLVNRHVLVTELDSLLAAQPGSERHAAVLFCDLDRFKQVNDTLGHEAGDRLLAEVAQRLSACVRQGDVIARLGGDEFVVLCTALESRDDGVHLAERIRDSLAEPIDIDGRDVLIGVSVGVAFVERIARSSMELLRAADLAMYRAKRRGGAHVTVFDHSFEADIAASLDLDAALSQALRRGELFLEYQPVVGIHDGEVEGFEALLRWQRGDTRLPPEVFLPLAERSGLIVDIGRWVLRTALARRAQWGPLRDRDDLVMSVNVSARELLEDDFADQVLAALRDNGVDPRHLVLELTEHALVDIRVAHPQLSRLRDHGVQVSLDDFGTGYSSLTQLRVLPVDELKLDRSFIQGLDRYDTRRRAVVESVVQLAIGLGIRLVVEGVETEAERSALVALGVQHAQGFLFGRPLDVDEASLLLVAPGRVVAHAS